MSSGGGLCLLMPSNLCVFLKLCLVLSLHLVKDSPLGERRCRPLAQLAQKAPIWLDDVSAIFHKHKRLVYVEILRVHDPRDD